MEVRSSLKDKVYVLPAGPWHELDEDLRGADRLFATPQPSNVFKEGPILHEENLY